MSINQWIYLSCVNQTNVKKFADESVQKSTIATHNGKINWWWSPYKLTGNDSFNSISSISMVWWNNKLAFLSGIKN